MKIENSKNIIRIKFDGFLSCLYIKEPKSADWPDCCGSVSRYYACFPSSEQDDEIRNQIEEKVSSVKSIEDLKNSGFLELLEEGEYNFELWKEKETCLIYCNENINSTDLLDVRQKKDIDSLVASESISQYCFYPYGRQLMFTRPMETLDLKRVQFYEKEIANGSRPLAIAIRLKDINHIDEES